MIEERTCLECVQYSEHKTLSGIYGYCGWMNVDISLYFAKKKAWCKGFEEKDEIIKSKI